MSFSPAHKHLLQQIDFQSDKGYLTPQELTRLGHYVNGLGERMRAYRQLREWEISLMQELVDRLPVELQQNDAALEQSIKQAVLVLRYAALGMLVDDVNLGKRRLEGWLPTMVEVYQTQAIDAFLHRSLNQQLPRVLTASQVALLQPALDAAQQLLYQSESAE